MRKIMIALSVLISTAAFAQKFEIGVKAGANISNFTGTSNWQNVKTKSLVGYHFGGFISFFTGPNFAIQPEVLFSSQGAKFESFGVTTDQKVNYINVPLMFKYRMAGGFYLEAGPQIGFKTGQSGSRADSIAKNMDLSLAGGLGFHSKIGLGLGVRYTAGISKVGDFTASNGIYPDYKNGVLQFSVFYALFNKGK